MNTSLDKTYSVGLIGARGYVGREVLRLIAGHPNLVLNFASSRELKGQAVSVLAKEAGPLLIENLSPEEAADRGPDIVILGLPNGLAAPFADAFDKVAPEILLIDLSADYRFNDSWAYGLPELYAEREKLSAARRIANPGCYATAAQTAIHPALSLLAGAPSVFGISGYSGAGTKSSPTNDTARLKDSLIPYKLTEHLHEKEVSRHLGRRVFFSPHVHPAFSGLMTTVHLSFAAPQTAEGLQALYEKAYQGFPLIQVQTAPPDLKDGTDISGVIVGGFSVSEDGLHGVVVSVEDNLQKGAAVQAIQNANIALGLAAYTGIIS